MEAGVSRSCTGSETRDVQIDGSRVTVELAADKHDGPGPGALLASGVRLQSFAEKGHAGRRVHAKSPRARWRKSGGDTPIGTWQCGHRSTSRRICMRLGLKFPVPQHQQALAAVWTGDGRGAVNRVIAQLTAKKPPNRISTAGPMQSTLRQQPNDRHQQHEREHGDSGSILRPRTSCRCRLGKSASCTSTPSLRRTVRTGRTRKMRTGGSAANARVPRAACLPVHGPH